MIFHVCRKTTWEEEKKNNCFGKEEMNTYGFIHTSTRQGLSKILSRFKEKEDYVVLSIDETDLNEDIVYEEKDKDHLYPHFYKLIPASSIREVFDLNTYLNQNRPKIIFTDVDGTLYDYNGNLPVSAVEAVRKLRANGHKVYLVTGRSKAENKKEIWDIGFDGMIGGNGSYVESEGKVVMHQRITYEQCRHIVDWLNSRELDFYEESNNGLFTSENFVRNAKETIQKYMTGKGASKEDVENIEVKDVIHGLVEHEDLYRDDLNKVSFILHSYQDHLDSIKEFPDLVAGTWGGKGDLALFGDLGVKDIDKAKAIETLLDYIGADKKDTFAIGDAKVDIPMLEYCEVGIAMGSGSDDIKAMADYVTDDTENDGFYKAFEHFGLI